MKLICSKESLLKTLNIAESVISTKSSISIFSNILFEAKDNKLYITAAETKLNFFSEIGADIEEEGIISIHCNKFYSIAKKLPSDEILITSDINNILTIKPKDNHKIFYNIKGVDSEKYPIKKNFDDLAFFSVKQDIIADMIKKTIFAISQNENRRFVNGAFFEKKDDYIYMVSTDGKRLSYIKKLVGNTEIIQKGIIIPTKILNETLKLCTGNGDIQLSVNDKNIFIKIDNFSFQSNLLEANFPPFEKVIPNDQTIFLKVKKNEIYESLDRISQISDKESHKITLSLTKNNIKLFSEDITIGSGEENIPIEYDDEELKIYLNYSFILDVLNVIKNEYVLFEFKNSNSTVTIKEDKNDNFIYIMMPMTS